MLKQPRRHAPALCALLLASGAAWSAPTYEFDIRGAPLDVALKQFAAQSGLQVAYFTKITEGRTAPAVSGTLTAEEALRKLLESSGLTFERVDGNTVAIHAAPAAPQGTPRRISISMQSELSAHGTSSAQTETVSEHSRNDGTGQVSEVIVTGTHIRGVTNDTMPMMMFDRDYIERSGYTNLMRLLESLPVGFTWRPLALAGFELSIDYFEIDYIDRISSAPDDAGALARREDYGGLITELANDEDAQAYLDARLANGDLFIDWEGIGATGVRYVFDFRQQNAARTQTSGFDVTMAYSFGRGADTFDLNLNVTHLREILTALARDTATFDQVDTYNQPLDWRGRFMAAWARGGFGTTVAVNYADDYINSSLAVDVPISSWTTVDLNLSYDFGRQPRAAWLDGTRVSLGVTNLFDREPPRAESGLPPFPTGYDVFNADATGRYLAGRFSKRW